jgi:hypothetical protein
LAISQLGIIDQNNFVAENCQRYDGLGLLLILRLLRHPPRLWSNTASIPSAILDLTSSDA